MSLWEPKLCEKIIINFTSWRDWSTCKAYSSPETIQILFAKLHIGLEQMSKELSTWIEKSYFQIEVGKVGFADARCNFWMKCFEKSFGCKVVDLHAFQKISIPLLRIVYTRPCGISSVATWFSFARNASRISNSGCSEYDLLVNGYSKNQFLQAAPKVYFPKMVWKWNIWPSHHFRITSI